MVFGFWRRSAGRARSPAVKGVLLSLFLLLGVGSGGPALADQSAPGPRGAPPLQFSGIFAFSYQKAARAGVASEPNGELELDAKLPMGPGFWKAQILGSTTPPGQGVSRIFPEANGLVGETLTGDGKGRFAVTQLYYTAPVGRGHLRGGVLYAPDYLDTNDVADDEYRQFLGQSFIFDPIIEFPFYAPAFEADAPLGRSLDVTVLVSSSNGLENGQHTYADMLTLGAEGHGAFAAIESEWKAAGLNGNIGLWRNDAVHPLLKSTGGGSGGGAESNFGLYANVSSAIGRLQWNLRLGLANPRVSSGANFIALALAYRWRVATLGFGIARIGVSPDQPPPRASVIQSEAYLRFDAGHGIALGPDLEYLRNSGFYPAKGSVWIGGVRAAYAF